MHAYTFELRCVAAIEVQATSETEARQALRNFGYDSGPTWDEPGLCGIGEIVVTLSNVYGDDADGGVLTEIDHEEV